jgi:hypothetical protein
MGMREEEEEEGGGPHESSKTKSQLRYEYESVDNMIGVISKVTLSLVPSLTPLNPVSSLTAVYLSEIGYHFMKMGISSEDLQDLILTKGLIC